MTGMENVLAAHWSASTHTEGNPFVDKCDGCGSVIFSWGDPTVTDGYKQLAAHQAQALQAAGFGNLHDAWAEGAKAARENDLAWSYKTGYPTTNPYPAPKVSET